MVTTNQLLASATSDRHKMSSKLSLSDIDTQNVVIVTDPSCFRVIQSQVTITSCISTSVYYISVYCTGRRSTVRGGLLYGEEVYRPLSLMLFDESPVGCFND